jgi:uncharacterized protein (DUF2236 family)
MMLASNDVSPKLRRLLLNGLSLALAGANVIMQLSRLPVGRGVVESTVESGSLYKHPIKRTRTTLGYIMIALFGTQHERTVLQREINRQHQSVHSGVGHDVEYNAFNPELQLWVAACMYRGLQDAITFLYGRPDTETLDSLYQFSSRFATTLQTPESMWPVDRTAFEEYWDDSLQHVVMDDSTRNYLYGIASLGFLPTPFRSILGPPHRFITAGFLPAIFRDELGLVWSSRRQHLFEYLITIFAFLNRLLPWPLREFPWNIALWDTRRRIRSARPIV